MTLADSDNLHIPGELLFSFDFWDSDDTCPHCGSGLVELVGNDYELWYECSACGCFSAYSVDDDAVEDALNRLLDSWNNNGDPFDTRQIFDAEQPGWD